MMARPGVRWTGRAPLGFRHAVPGRRPSEAGTASARPSADAAAPSMLRRELCDSGTAKPAPPCRSMKPSDAGQLKIDRTQKSRAVDGAASFADPHQGIGSIFGSGILHNQGISDDMRKGMAYALGKAFGHTKNRMSLLAYTGSTGRCLMMTGRTVRARALHHAAGARPLPAPPRL